LIETAGDPVSLYTAPITYDGQNGLGDTEEEWDQETINNGGKTWDLARSFMSAVENVATGESALSNYPLSNLSYSQYDWIPFMGYETSVWTNADGGPIASIPLEIPLNCTSERMVQYIQTQGYGLTQEDIDAFRANGIDANVVVYGALLPNCTYTAARASGIFDEDSGALTDAEIVEHALLVPHQSFHYAGGVAPEYGLIRNGELFRYAGATFELSPDDKTLAKDRSNWKEGRIVEGIEGLRYGNEVIEFNRTVISSGPLIQVVNKPGADITSTNPNNYDYIHSYMLVSTVKECPSPPSGIITTSQCLAFVFIECSRFNEDFEPLQNQFVQEPSSCIVSGEHCGVSLPCRLGDPNLTLRISTYRIPSGVEQKFCDGRRACRCCSRPPWNHSAKYSDRRHEATSFPPELNTRSIICAWNFGHGAFHQYCHCSKNQCCILYFHDIASFDRMLTFFGHVLP
jgi:hypothetical protein